MVHPRKDANDAINQELVRETVPQKLRLQLVVELENNIGISPTTWTSTSTGACHGGLTGKLQFEVEVIISVPRISLIQRLTLPILYNDMANPLDVPPYLLQSLIPTITAGNVTCAQAFGAWTFVIPHLGYC